MDSNHFISREIPARFLYRDNGSWREFDADVAETLRAGFRNAAVEVVVDGATWQFDFRRMVMVRLDGGDQRSVGWIDVDGNYFFPVGIERNEVPKVENKLNLRVNEGNVELISSKRRKREEEGDSVDLEVVSPRWQRTRVLDEKEKAFETVRDLFMNGFRTVDPGAKVTCIHQVVRSGEMEKGRLEVFRKQMEITKRIRGNANLAFAWYGAKGEGVEMILKYGVCEKSEVPGTETYGVGAYLSPPRSAHASAMLAKVDSYGEKHVILCRVIRGECEKIEAGSQQVYPSSVNFDTGVDNLENPKWYVVWAANMNTHILPECVVSYRPSNCSPGQVKGGPAANTLPIGPAFFKNLFTKLGSTLPSPTADEFQALLSAYKERKLTKDVFVKLLRGVVGDETLNAAIRDVRGCIES